MTASARIRSSFYKSNPSQTAEAKFEGKVRNQRQSGAVIQEHSSRTSTLDWKSDKLLESWAENEESEERDAERFSVAHLCVCHAPEASALGQINHRWTSNDKSQALAGERRQFSHDSLALSATGLLLQFVNLWLPLSMIQKRWNRFLHTIIDLSKPSGLVITCQTLWIQMFLIHSIQFVGSRENWSLGLRDEYQRKDHCYEDKLNKMNLFDQWN